MTHDVPAVKVDPLPVDGGYGGRVLLLRVAGEVDESDGPRLAEALADRTSHASESLTHVVLDLSRVRRLSSSGARALSGWAARVSGRRRRRVLVAAAPARVINALYEERAADVVELFPTVDAALAKACPGPLARTSPDDADAELRDLREQVRTLPLVAQAQGITMERYRLGGAEALALLEETARRFGLPLRVLAAAIVELPRPASPAGPWFPDRTEAGKAEPAAEFLWRSGADPADREQVLDVLLDEALRLTGTANADLQLVDPALGVLVLERQQGFSQEFQDFFAHVGDEGTACAAARRSGVRVSVPDVASDPIFAGRASREVVLESGTRSVQSTPVLARTGCCLGMISTHSTSTGRRLTAAEETAMDTLADEAAGWLTWYHHTVVRGALEHLHHLATSR